MIQAVEKARKKDPKGYKKKRAAKLLAAVLKVAFERYPERPDAGQLPLVDKALALAARAPGILLLHRRDRHHPAVPPLTAQPSQEYAHQHRRIQTIRLRPLALAGYRNACRMDDMRLDPASNEPARQPEAV